MIGSYLNLRNLNVFEKTRKARVRDLPRSYSTPYGRAAPWSPAALSRGISNITADSNIFSEDSSQWDVDLSSPSITPQSSSVNTPRLATPKFRSRVHPRGSVTHNEQTNIDDLHYIGSPNISHKRVAPVATPWTPGLARETSLHVNIDSEDEQSENESNAEVLSLDDISFHR